MRKSRWNNPVDLTEVRPLQGILCLPMDTVFTDSFKSPAWHAARFMQRDFARSSLLGTSIAHYVA